MTSAGTNIPLCAAHARIISKKHEVEHQTISNNYSKNIKNKTGPYRLFSNMWSLRGLRLGSWWWKVVVEGMCPYRKYLVNILRTLVLEKESSKWIMCGLVILPFQGFVDLLTFPCIFFSALWSFWGQLVMRGCCGWGGSQRNYSRGAYHGKYLLNILRTRVIVKRTI